MDEMTKVSVYQQLVEMVRAELPETFAITEEPGRMDVNSTKPVEISGRQRANVNLLSIIIQKHHVGYYFMPVYIDEGLRGALSPEAAKMLKGKSCFHVKKPLDEARTEEFRRLLHSGVQLYADKGWL